MTCLALWLALRVIGAFSVVVPAVARADWKREWEAELLYRATRRLRKEDLSWRTNISLISRALGSLPDAAWIRRQFTFDADAVHDAVHGVRVLLKAPGFTLIALLVFAIGIGATTAMLSVADTLFMRPLPVPQAERVMTIWQYNRETGATRQDVAPANAIDWIHRARSFEAIALAEPTGLNSEILGREPEYLKSTFVSEQFFKVLNTPMLLGRAFEATDYQQGARVAILSHPMWKNRFGGDSSVVGQAVRLGRGEPYTVVGIMPPNLELRLFDNRFQRQPEALVWLPKQGFVDFEINGRRTGFWNVLGRLRAGVSLAEAQAEFDALSAQLALEYPQTNRNVAAQVVPLRAHLVGSLSDVLPVLLGAAAILLIVACANVANLLLARGVARSREFAVRQAVGANRGRLIRQMLVESLLLASAGGIAGLALARWTLNAIGRLRPLDVAGVDRIPIDTRAAVIACGVIVLAAIVAGLTPSLQLSRPAAAAALKEGRGNSRRRVRSVLVIVEVAAALVLAVGAGLLVRSFVLIQRVDPGFSSERVAALQLFSSPRIDTAEKRIVFFDQLIGRMRALPGVVAAGGSTTIPFGEARLAIRTTPAIDGRPPASGEDAQIFTTAVTGDYFHVMGVPLIKGRLFDTTDSPTSRKVVLVSRSAAKKFWPESDPVGSRVRFRFNQAEFDAEVVGVVGEMRHDALDRPARAELFLPYSQAGFYSLTVVVRTAPESPTTVQAMKEQVWALDPFQTVFDATMLDDLVSWTLVGRRFSLFLLGGFAFATLLLATVGVYGVMSFSTGQRMREFGVRMALGAKRRDIVQLVVRDGLKLAGIGVIAGIVMALPLTRLLRVLLFGVTATDPSTFLGVSLALVLVAAAACYVPARLALRGDPVKALRADN
jgi:putative ABC transport system permease protein